MRPTILISKTLEKILDSIPHERIKNYKNHSGNIALSDYKRFLVKQKNIESKNILCFIGGFCDTYYRVLYDAFEVALEGDFNLEKRVGCGVQGAKTLKMGVARGSGRVMKKEGI